MLPKYKIEHDVPTCIGCGSCAAICPENWVMEGNKARCIKTDIGENLSCNMEAAKNCPVNCIHITEDDKKVI
ncbi:ferredoxin [Candidatus Woesearchaeota archaeon]|nr:MAG: ferredoxin [Candidatus Woesearchaeota archaeon]